MRGKYTGAGFSLLFLLFLLVPAASASDVAIGLRSVSKTRLEPGEQVSYQYYYRRGGPFEEIRVIHAMPAGARLLSWNDPHWACAQGAGAVTCSRNRYLFNDPDTLTLTIAAPDDPAGLVFAGTARIESEEPDPSTLDNEARWTMTVYHTFTVTTPDDFGAGSLRDALERANAECDGKLPCKVRFAEPMRIAPQSPLPRFTACDTVIDGGGYDGTTRNRSFDQPRRVEISGEDVGSGSGLVVASSCGDSFRSGPTIQGLAIHSFPENGINVEDPAHPDVLIVGCSVGTDATGTVAKPNGLRGISVAAPRAATTIQDCLVAGNARSGVALWSAGSVDLMGNLIGVRFGGVPLPNGGSGVFVNGGWVRSRHNAIEYNRDFGIAVGPGARHFVSEQDYIVLNGGIAIDWGLDGPTSTDSAGRMPPVPILLDAFYNPPRGRTVVRGILPVDATTPRDFYALRIYASADDYQGGVALLPYRPLGRAVGQPIEFQLELFGDYAGQVLTANTLRYPQADFGPDDSSEFSAGIRVR